MSAPRVLHILTKLELGGAQLNTLASVEDQLRRGYDVWLVAADGLLGPVARHRLGERWLRCDALVRSIAPWRDFQAAGALGEICRRLRPDLVHTHSSKAGILGRWAAYRGGVPVILHTAHGWGFHRGQGRAAYAFFRQAEAQAARITRRIIVVADADRDAALHAGVGRPEQFQTIRSGVELDPAALHAERNAVRAELAVPLDATLVVWVGNFKPQKAPLDMARVVRAATTHRPDMHVVILGDGPMRDVVERELEGLAGVHLLGWRADAQRVLAASDLLLHTALHEGLPRAVVEAMALGVPAIATRIDGIPEIVADGVSGLLFTPGATDAMAAALVLLHEDRAMRRRFADAARAAFRPEFQLATMLDQLDALYRQELASAGVSR